MSPVRFPVESSKVFSTDAAVAALKSNGSVVTWGDVGHGGNSSSVSSQISSGVSRIFSTSSGAFAALKTNGSVITWGANSSGGDSKIHLTAGDPISVSTQLSSGVSEVFSTPYALAALKNDGSVVTWGRGTHGGNSSSVSSGLNSGVSEIFSNDHAFAALKSDGSVVTWGNATNGGNSSSVADDLANPT